MEVRGKLHECASSYYHLLCLYGFWTLYLSFIDIKGARKGHP